MYHGERFNAYSHLAGFLLAVAALVLMLVKARNRRTAIGLPVH